MANFDFRLSSNSTDTFNDEVLPGTPFFLKGYNYIIKFKPKTDFWRFAIRLSSVKEIPFQRTTDRHSKNRELGLYDLQLAAGGKNANGKWAFPNNFAITTYGFENTDDTIGGTGSYLCNSEVIFQVKYDKNLLALVFSIATPGGEFFTKALPIPDNVNYFKIFAWADNIPYDITGSVEIQSDEDITPKGRLNPFRVGNVTFRLGDMFDSFALYNSSVIVLPAASDGNITGSIRNKVKELGISNPKVKKAGEVDLQRVQVGSNVEWAVYAYSVEIDKSNRKIIRSIASKLKEILQAAIGQSNKFINLPLLGTGAGRLEGPDVASVYDQEFNSDDCSLQILVNVQSGSVFEEIKMLFVGRLEELDEEVKQKPAQILDLERKFKIQIDHSAYKVDNEGRITSLALSNLKSPTLGFLSEFLFLQSFSLTNCSVENFTFLARMRHLVQLGLRGTAARNYGFIQKIRPLTSLEIVDTPLLTADFLSNVRNLTNLVLTNTQLSKIDAISNQGKLHSLFLSRNNIKDTSSLSSLKELQVLDLSFNFIEDLNFLKQLDSLETLIITKNNLSLLNPILGLRKLKYLKVDQNPIISKLKLILPEGDNHLPPIKNYYARQLESDKIKVTLPAKVVLLGNHASGKSSLLKFFLNNNLDSNTDTTHIIRIEKYPANTQSIPEAIFFDFGGQDYYHGIYRAFLSGGSVYIVLWDSNNNLNKRRKGNDDILTQDFTLNYWLSQKKYVEQQKHGGDIDPLLIIQTHADENPGRETFYDPKKRFRIDNEFYVSLKTGVDKLESEPAILNKAALAYLRASIVNHINIGKTEEEEQLWYLQFVTYILQQSTLDTHNSRNVINEILPHYGGPEIEKYDYLLDTLDQLHKRGLILFFKDEMPEVAWLNPAKLAEHVHDQILNKTIVGNGIVKESQFTGYDPKVVQLLQLQKVIFKHEPVGEEPEYIIPNYLPLVEKDGPDFDLFTFDLGKPLFTLRFVDFLPFGLVNQLICFFKNFGTDRKKFWRDQLLFTFRSKAKILINLDFQRLEVKCHAFFNKDCNTQDKKDITKYLFYSILSIYWDLSILDYEDFLAANKRTIKRENYPVDNPLYNKLSDYESLYETLECRPDDLYISLDEKHYVNYCELCALEDSYTINAHVLNDKNLFEDSTVPISIFQFQPFTNKELKRTKRVVISYSKKDLKLVNKFKDYLVPLYQNGLIDEPWYCTELVAGREWNEEIKQRFNDADIIFFMISENLMTTKYVLENEVKTAIDRWNAEKSVMIVPIQLVHYNFKRKDAYDLSRFTGLPYTLRPVVDFKNQNMAWHTISESVRIMIEKNLDPGSDDGNLTAELKQIYESIVKEKFDLH